MNKELVLYLVNEDLQDMSGNTRKVLTQVDSIKEAKRIVDIIRMIKPQYVYEVYELLLYPSNQEYKDVLKYGYKIAYMGLDNKEFERTVL